MFITLRVEKHLQHKSDRFAIASILWKSNLRRFPKPQRCDEGKHRSIYFLSPFPLSTSTDLLSVY